MMNVSRNDIIRYKLYEELKDNGYKTLYSNQYIPKEKIFSKEIDIEHIIPQSRLFDDSLSNKTLEYKAINIEKGNKTAYDFVKENTWATPDGRHAGQRISRGCNPGETSENIDAATLMNSLRSIDMAEYPGCVFLYKDVSDHGTFNTEIEDSSQKVTMCQ